MISVVEYPAVTCECEPPARRWNGYGTCLRCGGAYVASGELEPIEIPAVEEPRS